MMAQDQITLAMLFHIHVGRKVVGIEPRTVPLQGGYSTDL